MMGTSFSRYAAEAAISKRVYRVYDEMYKTGNPVKVVNGKLSERTVTGAPLNFTLPWYGIQKTNPPASAVSSVTLPTARGLQKKRLNLSVAWPAPRSLNPSVRWPGHRRFICRVHAGGPFAGGAPRHNGQLCDEATPAPAMQPQLHLMVLRCHHLTKYPHSAGRRPPRAHRRGGTGPKGRAELSMGAGGGHG